MPFSFIEVAKSVNAIVFDGFTEATRGFTLLSTDTFIFVADIAIVALRAARGREVGTGQVLGPTDALDSL